MNTRILILGLFVIILANKDSFVVSLTHTLSNIDTF